LILVAFTDSSGQIQVYNEKDGLLTAFQAHSSPINRIRYLPNGFVATCSSDNTVKIWDPTNITDWKLIQTYSDHTGGVVSFENINTDTVASSAYDQTIQIWSIKTGTRLHLLTNQQNNYQNVLSLKFYSDKNGIGHLTAGLADGYIFIYNLNNMSVVGSLHKHLNQVNDLELIKNGNEILLASSSDDNSIKIWDLTTYMCKFTLNGHTNKVIGLKLVSNDIIASGSLDKTVILWNTTAGKLFRTLNGHTGDIAYSIDLANKDEQRLVSGSYDLYLKFWNISSGQLLNSVPTNLAISSLTVITQSTNNGIKI